YLVLHLKDIGQLAVVSFGPQLVAVGRVHELRGNAQPITGASHTALEHGLDVESLGDGTRVFVLALEREGRSPCRDPQALDMSERIENLFRDAIGEVLVVGAAEIAEWEDGNRLLDRRLEMRRAPRPRCVEFHQLEFHVSDVTGASLEVLAEATAQQFASSRD